MNCLECKLNKKPISDIIVPNSEVLLVLDLPYIFKNNSYDPFPIQYKKIIDELLQTYCHINISQVSITHAIRCQVPFKERRTHSVLMQYRQHCRSNFVNVMQIVKPKFVIAFGNIAISQVFNKSTTVARCRNKIITNPEFNCNVFATYSLNFIYSKGGAVDTNPYWHLFLNDWIFLKNKLFKHTTSVENYEHLENINDFANSKALAIDAEWSSTGNLLIFSISNGEITRYVFPEDLTPELKNNLYKLFTNKIIVLANRPVDEKVLIDNGITFPKKCLLVDLFNIAKLVDDNLPISLDNIAQRFCHQLKLSDVDNTVKQNMELMDKQLLIKYNCKDSLITHKAFQAVLKQLLLDKRLINYWKHLTLPVENTLANIGMQPFHIDRQKLIQNKAKVAKLMFEISTSLISQIPDNIIKNSIKDDSEVSLTKSTLVTNYLFKDTCGLKLKVKKTTPTGKPSLDEEALIDYSDIPWVNNYNKWKALHKLYTTFFKTVETNLDTNDNLYIKMVLWTTVTGRTSSFNPNIQNIPQRMDYVENLKELFAAPPGWVIGVRDLAQSEIRIMGWLANDLHILTALKNNIDIHTLTASLLLNKSIEKISKEERQLSKAINFGFLYGASAKTFKEYAKNNYKVELSLEEAEYFRNKFFEKYSAIPVFHKKCITMAKTKGFIHNVFGRIRRLPAIHSEDLFLRGEAERQAINFPIQSCSAEITLIGMYLFWKEIQNKNDVQLLWQIHDSIFFMAKEDKLTYYMNILKDCMENKTKTYVSKHFNIDIKYPIVSDAKVGQSWASLTEC